jgi:hypothetical protein
MAHPYPVTVSQPAPRPRAPGPRPRGTKPTGASPSFSRPRPPPTVSNHVRPPCPLQWLSVEDKSKLPSPHRKRRRSTAEGHSSASPRLADSSAPPSPAPLQPLQAPGKHCVALLQPLRAFWLGVPMLHRCSPLPRAPPRGRVVSNPKPPGRHLLKHRVVATHLYGPLTDADNLRSNLPPSFPLCHVAPLWRATHG